MSGRTVLAVAWLSLAATLVGLGFAWDVQGLWAVLVIGLVGVALLGITTIGAMVTEKPERRLTYEDYEGVTGLRDVGQHGLSARGARKIGETGE